MVWVGLQGIVRLGNRIVFIGREVDRDCSVLAGILVTLRDILMGEDNGLWWPIV